MSRLKAALLVCAFAAVTAMPCMGGEAAGEYDYDEDLLSPEERAALELKRRREAQPVLACEPTRLHAKAKEGEAVMLRLTVLNKGGRTLRWSVTSAPGWLTLDRRSGDLGFEGKQLLVIDARPTSAGAVRGNITLDAPGAANSPSTVSVVLDVEPVRRPPRPREEPVVREQTPRPPPERPRRRRFGVRAGYSKLSTGDRGNVNGSALFGLRLDVGGSPKVAWELGLDVAGADASNGNYSSTLFAGRVDALFGMGDQRRGYLLAGLHGLVENGEELGVKYTNYVGALGLGGGYRFGGGRYDLRASYSALLGSGNSSGLLVVSAGLGF